MNFLLFMGFSMLETSAMYYLIFRLFKIDVMTAEIVLAGLVLGFVSYELRNQYHLAQLDVLVQMALMCAFMWLLFRIHLFYAVVLTGMMCQSYYLLQVLYYLAMSQAGLFGGHLPYPLRLSTYLLQTLSAATAFYIGRHVHRKRRGFDFVPDKPRGRLPLRKRDLILFALTVLSIAAVFFSTYLGARLIAFYTIVPLSFALILYAYMVVSYRKDREET